MVKPDWIILPSLDSTKLIPFTDFGFTKATRTYSAISDSFDVTFQAIVVLMLSTVIFVLQNPLNQLAV